MMCSAWCVSNNEIYDMSVKLHDALVQKGDTIAAAKMIVDCNEDAYYQKITKGRLLNSDQEKILKGEVSLKVNGNLNKLTKIIGDLKQLTGGLESKVTSVSPTLFKIDNNTELLVMFVAITFAFGEPPDRLQYMLDVPGIETYNDVLMFNSVPVFKGKVTK